MLHLILGNNKESIEKQIEKTAPNLPVLKMDPFGFDADLLRGEIESTSLFETNDENEKAIVLDGIFDNSEHFEFLKSFAPVLTASSKKVFIIERDLLKEDKMFWEDMGALIFDLKDKKEREYGYSPFALQDAIGERNVKNIWIEYQRLRQIGIEAEDVVHKIVGKVRDLTAITSGATKEDLGIKSDFPYNKSKRDVKNWKPLDLQNLYTNLVSIYHRSRMEAGEELDIAIEKTLLSL